MFLNKRIRKYLFALLAFAVLSSKHILIYNEETLVALSFLAFVLYVYFSFGDRIKEALNERAEGIRIQFENSLLLTEREKQGLLGEHKKGVGSVEPIERVALFTLAPFKQSKHEKGVFFSLSQDIVQKLKRLSQKQTGVTVGQTLGQLMGEKCIETVLVFSQKRKSSLSQNKKTKGSSFKNEIFPLLPDIQKTLSRRV